ncbi:Uncharacterised protein [Raoultella ornithinolytica]|nr:Uncharacterised protein [Raoultella ornithinolytica]
MSTALRCAGEVCDQSPRFQNAARGLNGEVDVGLFTAGDVRQSLLGGRVDGFTWYYRQQSSIRH